MNRWLISAQELLACHRRADVVVVDCRFNLAAAAAGELAYREGHIPGARYLHLERDLSAPRRPGGYGGRHPLPDPHYFAIALQRIGVDSEPLSSVVAYDDHGVGFAARLWWLLRWCGHEQVRVLDGGLRAWRREAGQRLSQEIPHVAAGNFVAEPRDDMTLGRQEIAALSARLCDGAGGVRLIDSREEKRYRGEEEPIDVIAGHIPGAVNFPWQQAMDEQGHLLSASEQRARWGAVADEERLAVYCGSGVTACVNLLALAMIGRDDARLYPGSWSDWISEVPHA